MRRQPDKKEGAHEDHHEATTAALARRDHARRSARRTGPLDRRAERVRRLRPWRQYHRDLRQRPRRSAGNGAWLWIELNANGTGDYTGAICIYAGSGGLNGAESDTGDVTWSDTAGTLTITGITVIHHTVPLTITVPDSHGHYTEPSASVMAPNLITGGTAQIQVAP